MTDSVDPREHALNEAARDDIGSGHILASIYVGDQLRRIADVLENSQDGTGTLTVHTSEER